MNASKKPPLRARGLIIIMDLPSQPKLVADGNQLASVLRIHDAVVNAFRPRRARTPNVMVHVVVLAVFIRHRFRRREA
jgi:putative NADH-flavin reductase